MSTQSIICLIIFALAVISYILNKIPMGLTSLTAMFLLIVTGCVDPAAALGNFANSSAIIMASMFVIAAGLNRTQMVHKISNLVYKVSGGSFTKGMIGYVLVTALIAQVVPSAILIFSICYPLVADYCRKLGVSPSKAMFSIGLISITCVGLLPIGAGAAAYITNNTLLETYGAGAEFRFGIFSQMYAKLPMMIVLIAYAIWGAPKMAPDKGVVESDAKGKTMVEQKPLDPVREVFGYGIFLVVVVCLIFVDYLPVTSWQICLGGALLTVLTGVLSEREAVSNLNLPVVFLYVGGLTMGQALVATGAGDFIGGTIAGMLGEHPNSYVVGLVFFLIPFLLTQVMVNHSVIQSIQPITIMTCVALGYNPVGPLILTVTGSLSAFITPMATPSVPLMMSIGGYDQKDMIKMSWLPAIIACITAVGWTMTIFPCY